jgi:hypothetical protein
MSAGYKHFSRWSFGDEVWHKATKDKGIIIGIILRPDSAANYIVVFEDSRVEANCLEFELTDEQPTSIETEKK